MRKIIALVIIFCIVISISALPTKALSISSNHDVVSPSSGINVNINSLNDGYSNLDKIQSTMPPLLFKDTPILGTTIGNLQQDTNQPSDTSTRGIEDPEMGVIGGGGTTNPTYQGILYSTYDGENVLSLISYQLNLSHFNSSNTIYHQDLAVASSIASALAYDNNYISISSGGTLTTTSSNAVSKWMEFHEFTDYQNFDLNDYPQYDDCHMSEMFIGHKTRTINGVTDNIVCIIIRGTNGTLDEWQSNFDVGSTTESPRHNEWTDITNHRGFDITANRLNLLLENYLSTYCSGTDIKLWITGHSRGGALANVLADKRILSGDTVYCYTFASPTTTVYSGAQQSRYNCIFNIINEDDLVPNLPLNTWGFRRYGVDKTMSIEDSCAGEWNTLTNYTFSYTSNRSSMQNTISALQGVSTSRNNCYVYRTSTDGYHNISKVTQSERDSALNTQLSIYPSITNGLYYYETSYTSGYYTASIHQTPAFFMQVLAAQMGGTLSAMNFVKLNVAPYLENAKFSIAWLAAFNNVAHPHFVQSYYLIATKTT